MSRFHRTLADTDALAVSVNVHVRRRVPPLEHAPDQMASRPFEMLSVIDVPVVNDADPVLPTLTLIPDGLDVTRSPLRPVAVTVSVAVCAGPPWTVNRRVEENGPKTPAELRARTRHQSGCAGSPLSVTCEAVAVGLATSGAAIVDELSTWMS